jgi:hypothetical protein
MSHEPFSLCSRGFARTNLGGKCWASTRARSLGALYRADSEELKAGLCAEFQLVPPVLEFSALDAFLRDELRTEARFGFVRIDGVRRLTYSSAASQALLLTVLQITDQAELTRRLRLGMHRLTQTEYDAIIRGLTA